MASRVAAWVERLERQGVRTCHWKGAAALERGLRGERDLDFLVSPADWEAASRALLELDFKATRPRFGAEAAGTSHCFGREPGQERLLHLHLHDRVLTGEDWINSHALPFDRPLLASPSSVHGVRVPTPPLEVVLTVLKHAIRWGSLPDRVTAWLRPKDERAELARLLTDANVEAALPLVNEHCPALDAAIFRACAAALREDPGRAARLRLAARVRRVLRPWARQSGAARPVAYAQVLAARARRLFDGDRRDKALRGAGVTIAFRDAGVREATRRWLGQAFAVRVSNALEPRALAAGEIVLADARPGAAPDLRIESAALDEPTRARIWAAL